MVFNASYSDEEKAKAVARSVERSVTATAEEMNINPSNIRRWARDAGVDLSDEYSRARTAAATKAAQMKRRQQVEESKGRQSVLLATIAELAGTLEVDVLKDVRKKITAGETLDKLPVTLREIVGARTRALHDLSLLNGEATERVDVVPTTAEASAVRDAIRTRMHVIKGGAPGAQAS